MPSNNKKNITMEDVIDEIKKQINNFVSSKEMFDTKELSETQNDGIRIPSCFTGVVSDVDFESGSISVSSAYLYGDIKDGKEQSGSGDYIIQARLSATLRAWGLAWKKPVEYKATINESPIKGELSVQGSDLSTTNLPILVSGSGNAPVAGTAISPVGPAPFVTAVTVPFITSSNIANGVYNFSGIYPKFGGKSTIYTEEEKFLQIPRRGHLWPFNAIKEGWRENDEFILSGDIVLCTALNDDLKNIVVFDVLEFS